MSNCGCNNNQGFLMGGQGGYGNTFFVILILFILLAIIFGAFIGW